MAEDLLTTAAVSANAGEFEILESGAYDGVCIGVTCRNFKKYQSEDLEPKFQFVFQIADNGKNHYLRTLPMRNVINDKSNLYLFLNSWTGATLDKLANGIDLKKLVGLKAQVVVGEAEREGKKYNSITSVIKAKKSATTAVVADDKVPAYLAKDLLAAKWADGLSFAEPKVDATAEVPFTDEDLVKAAEAYKANKTDDDSLPF